MKYKSIKCSQCDETFYNGRDYREHWEKKHLEYAMKHAKTNRNNYVEKRVEKIYRLP